MRKFNNIYDLVSAYSLQNLKSFFSDLRKWGEIRSISEIREEIIKEREYTLKNKVKIDFNSYTSKLENVPTGASYIKGFGYVIQ